MPVIKELQEKVNKKFRSSDSRYNGFNVAMTEEKEGGTTSATAATRGNTSATAAASRTNGALVPKVGPCYLSPSLFCYGSSSFFELDNRDGKVIVSY